MNLGHAYTLVVWLGIAQILVALAALVLARPDARPWGGLAASIATLCCGLLLRLYFDPPYQARLGAWAWLVFSYALAWSVTIWFRRVWAIESDEPPPRPSVLGTFGVAAEGALADFAAVLWHVIVVAPALICGAFALFGIAQELPH